MMCSNQVTVGEKLHLLGDSLQEVGLETFQHRPAVGN